MARIEKHPILDFKKGKEVTSFYEDIEKKRTE
jgi:hypothetical protein